MKCDFCKTDLNEYEFYALRKYKDPEKTIGLMASFNFCNKGCIDNYIDLDDENIFKSFDKYSISRCGAYKDCERINNLRVMCEDVEPLYKSYNPMDPLGTLNFAKTLAPHCQPGEVGIIRASIKLMDILETFDKKYQKSSNEMISQSEEMVKHSKDMKWLTVFIAIFTVINLLILLFQ